MNLRFKLLKHYGLLSILIKKIYTDDNDLIRRYVMYVNCAHGKGIKFVREELKFFAKTHLNVNGTGYFKTIVLSNADKLTIDAQSALRRCIEVFNHTTRFFIIVEDKNRLLKPIISRFCDIYVPIPIINNKAVNLHEYRIAQCFSNKLNQTRMRWLSNRLSKLTITNYAAAVKESVTLYEKGYSGIDLVQYIEASAPENTSKYKMLITFNKIKREFRNEKLLILFFLNFMYLRSDYDLENIHIM